MKKPVLDQRTQSDVMEQLRLRAASYTPEWRFDGDPSDPGAALAAVFSEMYVHTLDRFNGLPHKFYTEFLNQLGVTEPDVISAGGYVRFAIHSAAENAVVVPEKTLLGAASANGGQSILYETETRIEATPAKLAAVYYYDKNDDILQEMDLNRAGQALFAPLDGENLSRHTLFLSQNEVLAVEGACYIMVELHQKVQFQDRMLAEQLSDPSRAAWSWYNGESWVLFDKVSLAGEKIVLQKSAKEPFAPDEDGHLAIRCRMFRPEGEILLDKVLLSSAPEDDSPVESMAFGDLLLEEGRGYCFGRRPTIYDMFYLRSDRVFCKRGTEVALQLTISTEAENPQQGTKDYNWNQYVINKDDALPVVPDDVVIRRVIWEYFNGEGWAPLRTGGDNNPFLPADSIKRRVLSFHVPNDIKRVSVNAEEGYYIRARIAEMENAYSLHPRWMLPYVTAASCRWQYPKGCRCSYLSSYNDGTVISIADADNVEHLQLRAFYPTDANGRSIYFCFDRSPHALPLTMLLQLRHAGTLPEKANFEALRNGQFHAVRTTDGTKNFSATGIISLYLPEALTRAELFGREGFWLRASCEATRYQEKFLPKLDAIDINVVPIIQRQQADEQYFSTESYAKNKTIHLLHTPVQSAEVWLDETEHISAFELQSLRAQFHTLRVEKDSDGEEHFWVRWQRISDMRLADGSERVYELDTMAGEIRFGNDIHGRIPPKGSDNICVYYAYGGGVNGNLPVGSVTNLLGAIPMVDNMTNITATCGGTDGGNREWLEDVGALRLRHRDRAMGVDDYENMVRQQFPRVHRVKCFAGYDETGHRVPGHVTVVFLCAEATHAADTEAVAGQIFRYLAEHSDCSVVSGHRLHVIPATEIKVCVEAQLKLEDLNTAANTQQQLTQEIETLINSVWRQRGIGQRLHIEELYELLSQAPNVEQLHQVLIRGVYIENGVERACNLEEENHLTYAAVRSGEHLIRVM